jgi:hypothetical protein
MLGAMSMALTACSLATPLDNLGSGPATATTGAGGSGNGGAAGAAPSSSQTTGGSGGAPASYRDVVLSDMPIGYWRLGDSGNLTAVDEIGDTPGTYLGDFLQGAPGALAGDPDTAVEFAGTNGVIAFGDVFDLQSFTIELWVRPAPPLSEYRHLVSKRQMDTNGSQGYGIYDHADTGLKFEVVRDSQYSAVSTKNYLPRAWNHLVGTFDGTSVRFFVNGDEVNPASVKPLTLANIDGPFLIGAVNAAGVGAFDGTLDEVAIYDKALTLFRVVAHYQAGQR